MLHTLVTALHAPAHRTYACPCGTACSCSRRLRRQRPWPPPSCQGSSGGTSTFFERAAADVSNTHPPQRLDHILAVHEQRMAADAVHVLADEPWHDAALIPVGVLRVSAAAGADALPGDAPSGSTRLCFLAADAVLALGERCSGAERDAVCALAWLVRERRARAAAERAWLRLSLIHI